MMKTKCLIMGLVLFLAVSCSPLEKIPEKDHDSEFYEIDASSPLNAILIKALKEKKPVRIVHDYSAASLSINFMDSSEITTRTREVNSYCPNVWTSDQLITSGTKVLEGVIVEYVGVNRYFNATTRVYRLKYLYAINN